MRRYQVTLASGTTEIMKSGGFSSRDNYMYRQFNIHKYYVLPTQCIYVFYVDLRTNIYYFPIQH